MKFEYIPCDASAGDLGFVASFSLTLRQGIEYRKKDAISLLNYLMDQKTGISSPIQKSLDWRNVPNPKRISTTLGEKVAGVQRKEKYKM